MKDVCVEDGKGGMGWGWSVRQQRSWLGRGGVFGPKVVSTCMAGLYI